MLSATMQMAAVGSYLWIQCTRNSSRSSNSLGRRLCTGTDTFAEDFGSDDDRRSIHALPHCGVRQGVLWSRNQANVRRLQRARVTERVAPVHLELQQTSLCAAVERQSCLAEELKISASGVQRIIVTSCAQA